MRHSDRSVGVARTGRELDEAAADRDASRPRGWPTGPAAAMAVAVRQRAYENWEAAGCPPGDGVGFWLQAEREMQWHDR